MKSMGALVTLLVLLAGCALPEAGYVPSPANTREISLYLGDGYTFTTTYTYVPSTARLTGHWWGTRATGRYVRDAQVQLSLLEAHHLESLLGSIRLEIPEGSEGCWEDVVNLSIAFVAPSGDAQVYYSDPEKESCGRSNSFVKKEDALSALEAFRALLPEPP